MRMKHGSDRGPTISVKPRLLAAFTAVAMMFATAVPAMLPKNASADDTLADGATCTPGSIEMGAPDVSGSNNVGKDDDVATWVGGNMYLGAPVDATTTQYGLNEAAIDVTYAVEAEGLTLVNGKLLSNATKKSWDQYGFRFGVVGFGSQFRPAAGSDSLVIGGNTSDVTLKDFFGTDVNALAFESRGRGWIGLDTAYNAQIAGSPSGRLNADNATHVLPDPAEGYTRVFVKGNSYSKLYAWDGNTKLNGDWGGQTLQTFCGVWRYTDVKNSGKDFDVKPNNQDQNGDGLPQYSVDAVQASQHDNSVMIMPGEGTTVTYGAPSCGAATTGNVTNVIVPSKDNSNNPVKPQFTYNGTSLEPSRNLGQWYVFEVPITGRSFSVTAYGNTTVTVPGTAPTYTIWNKAAEKGDPASLNHLDADLYSIYSRATDSKVNWNVAKPLDSVKINNKTKKFSDYNNTIKNQSANFAGADGQIKVGTPTFAPEQTGYDRNKYNGEANIKLNFGAQTEKLITFDGKGATGDTIVFSLPASYLTNKQGEVTTNGIDFMFKNVGKKTVIVNVVNDDGADADTTNTIDFNTGWRFWWGEGEKTVDISNGYYEKADQTVKEAYSKASQSIMWNFPSTSKLTIRGGQVTSGQATEWKAKGTNNVITFDAKQAVIHDDPSAAMIGSIMVPNGSFEDHVSTNGRVYVGGDFMMYNPTAAPNSNQFWQGESASLIDMDQERHNFPWHGALSTQCAAIGWSKVKKNQDGTYEALGGTSWKVYATLANAVTGKPTLLPGTVVDNNISTGDANSTPGAFTINNLKEKATYYIQEANAPAGYKVNPYIYQIRTGDNGTTSTTISKVYKIENGNAVEITSSDADKLLNGNSIINENDDVDISWGKKSSEDTSNTPTALPGSEWTLTDKDGNKYTITDNTTQATGVQIWYNGADKSGKSLGEFEMGGELQLSAKVTPDGASPAVTWKSSDPDYVQVSRTGRVFLSSYNPKTNGEVTITATSDDNTEATASVTLKVKPIAPTKFELTNNGSSVTSLNMNVGESEQLTATVEPSTLTPVWSTGDASVATVKNGLITATGEGTTTITATVGNTVKSVTVTVTDKKKTVIYVKSNLVTDNDKRYQYIITNLDNWALNKNHTLTQSKYEGYYSTTIQTDGNAFQFQLWNGSSAYYKPNGVGQLQINGGSTGLNWYSPAGTTALTINQWNDAYTGTPHAGYSLTRPSEAQAEAAPADADVAPQSDDVVMDESGVVPLADESTDTPADGDNTNNQPSYTIDRDGRTGMFKLSGLAPGTYYLQESKAPDGFLVNPTVYTIVIGQDGKITWDTQSTTAVYVHWPNAKQTPRILYWTGEEPSDAVAAKAPSMTAQACVEGSEGWYKYDVPIDGEAFNVKITAGDETYKVGDNEVVAIAGTKDAYTINDNNDNKVTEGKPAKECPTATTTIYVQSTDPENTNTPRILYWDPATTTDRPSWGDDNANGLWMSPEACAGNGMYKYDVPITGKSFNVQVKIGDTLYKVGDSDVITVAGKKNAYTIADGKLSDQVPSNSCPALLPPSVGGVMWISDTPTQVEWDKVDAGYEGSEFDTKNPIAESIWELEKFTPNGDNGTYTSVEGYDNITDCVPTSDSSCSKTMDKNNEAGKFKLMGLNDGLYRLHEKEAPTGYTGSDAYFYFEMVTSNPTKFVKGTATSFDKTTGLTSNGEGSANVVDKVVPNYRKLGTVDWTKVSSEEPNGDPLAGAEWKIKFKAEGANAYGTEYTIVDCTSGDCAVPENPSQPAWTYDRDPAAGEFELENLQWGDYSFYESKAPDGYYPSDKTYTFTVDKENLTGIVISNSLAGASRASGNKIPNTPGFELPSTGGEGNTLIVLFGFALIAISMVGCAIAMRKRI